MTPAVAAARDRAIAARLDQRMDAAWSEICQAASAAPADPQIAFMHAQIAFETGRDSGALFAHAQVLAPDDLAVRRSRAAALAEAGDVSLAEALLDSALRAHPDWLDGHKALASLRSTRGLTAPPDESYARACAALPLSRALRLAWFHSLCLTRDWAGAESVLADGERLFADDRSIAIARAFLNSETGTVRDDPFVGLADVRDTGLDLAQVRYHMRGLRLDRAEAIARRNLATPAATNFWPYLATIWRMTGDPLGDWLGGPDAFIAIYHLGLKPTELSALATILRQRHTMQSPYPDQSVRGGTQTGGQLLFHHDPHIQSVRTRIAARVRDYVDALPPPDARHPLLAPRRDEIRFAGSWSVRLRGRGNHVSHTHPQGWISSAFYVALPDTRGAEARNAGALQFGVPPRELELDLPPIATIEPVAGQLVLFPSTLWHGTVPFASGERLTIAFDVARPR